MESHCQSVLGHEIRLTAERWAHIVESHDYMAGNYDLLLETLISPDQVVQSPECEHYALRNYSSTSLGPKTCVVIYRDDDNGFVITSLLTSKPQQFVKRGVTVWKQ
jgi:hypothetical protein